jgi:hypothetical protein
MGSHAAAAAAAVVVVMVSLGSKLHYAVGGLKFHFTDHSFDRAQLICGASRVSNLAPLEFKSHTSVPQPTCSIWVCFVTKYVFYAWFQLENLLPIMNRLKTVDGCRACAFLCKVNRQNGNLCRHQYLFVFPVETRFKSRHEWEEFDLILVMRGKTILLSHRLASLIYRMAGKTSTRISCM